MIAFAPSPVKAQTVAPGPYYANPSWDQTLACTTLATCPRFIVLSNMNSAAVLDRETGLVWERSPSTSTSIWNAFAAEFHCINLNVGNRKGWRLPTVQELASLVDGDPANTSSPRLPPGHPFTDVQSLSPNFYWSATTASSNLGAVWAVKFIDGSMLQAGKTLNTGFSWCARGGQGVDPQ